MWKVIQGDEKAEFIKECLNKKYTYNDVIIVNTVKHPKALKSDQASVEDLVSSDIVILVKVD